MGSLFGFIIGICLGFAGPLWADSFIDKANKEIWQPPQKISTKIGGIYT